MTEELTPEQIAANEAAEAARIAAAAAEAGMTVPEYEVAIAEERRLLAEAAIAADLAAAKAAAEQAEADAAAGAQPSGRPLPPSKIAFVIDGSLVDVLHVDERLAAIFLSNPTMVDVTGTYDTENPIALDSTYDPATGEFTPPTV
jgi:hypothetical protein